MTINEQLRQANKELRIMRSKTCDKCGAFEPKTTQIVNKLYNTTGILCQSCFHNYLRDN